MAVTLARPTERRPLVPVMHEPLVETKRDAVFVVIAALNEDRVLGRVVNEVMARGYQCVVVDDGSRDGTAEVARRAGATVLNHLVPLGQGAALQTGIDWALVHEADVIVTFDADGQHRAADIQPMCDALLEHDAAFALGSRFPGRAMNMPRSRWLLLQAATWFTRFTTGMAVTDTHNGLRAMTRQGAANIRLSQARMAHASEILHQIAASRLPWVEVPVTIEYDEYSLAKGQTLGGSVTIMVDLFMGALQR